MPTSWRENTYSNTHRDKRWKINRADLSTQVYVCVHVRVCTDEIMPVEFLYREYEAGMVIKQGFYSFWSLVTGPKDC